MIRKIKDLFFSRNFFLYIIFGGLATVVDWGSFAFVAYIFGWYYAFAVIISFIFGSIVNFSLNKYFNFNNKYSDLKKQFIVYLIIALIGLVFTLILMWLMIELGGVGKMSARMITTFIVLIYNFLGHKFVTFKKFK